MSESAHYDPLVHVGQPDHPDAQAQARADLGRAIRDIGHAVTGHHVPISLLEEATTSLRSLVECFESGTPRNRIEQAPLNARWNPAPPDGAQMFAHDERPISGRSSPWGLDLHIVRDGDEVVATVTLRAAHEGAPGRSHGGIVAALFDDVSGFVLNLLETPAYTGELTVRYEAGTPIGVPLECRCRAERREGRKIYMTGELTEAGRDREHDGERKVLARMRGLFLAIDRSRFLAGG